MCVCTKLLQSCPTLCDPLDCSPPGSSVPGILQARTLERVATPSSRDSFPIQGSPALEGGFFTTRATWEPHWTNTTHTVCLIPRDTGSLAEPGVTPWATVRGVSKSQTHLSMHTGVHRALSARLKLTRK